MSSSISAANTSPRVVTAKEWHQQAETLFGPDEMQWRFVCPCCGFVQSVQDYKDSGAPLAEVAVVCVGRYRERARRAFEEDGPGPCNYAGYGLFRLNPVDVDGLRVFAFAEPDASVEVRG